MFNEKLWKEVVKFHGHECPGLAIGFKASEAIKEKMDFLFSEDEEIVCVVENDACGVDAIQYIMGCTFGKGNLIFRDIGKHAYSFFNRKNGHSMRIVLKSFNKEEKVERKDRMAMILNADAKDLFVFKKPEYETPEKAKIFNSLECEICNENISESRARLQNGKKVCLDCYDEYR